MLFGDWIRVFELKPRYLLAVWLFGALLLLSPSYISERFGFAGIVTHYRGWIGLGTLAFFVLWVVQLTAVLRNKKEKEQRRADSSMRATNRNLEISEYSVEEGNFHSSLFSSSEPANRVRGSK